MHLLNLRRSMFNIQRSMFVLSPMNDLRFALRQLLKNPGFTVVAVLTLALGIGTTASVFSLIHGVLLTPPPYRKPEQIALLTPERIDGRPNAPGCTAAQWLEWRQQAKSFETMAGYYVGHQFLILPDGSEFLQCMPIMPEYFSVIGVKPLLGRAFLSADTPRPETRASVVILGYDLWQRRFHGDRGIVGKTVRLSRVPPLTVVGVMPPGIRFLPSPTDAAEPNYDVNALVDYWSPAGLALESKERSWNVIGRLRDGVTLRQAQAELTAIAARQAQADPDLKGITVKARLLTAELNRDSDQLLLPLSGAVILILFIACGNVAGLLLVRGLQRQQEYAVRCALGAGRAQLFRQVLTESLLLAFCGAVFGAGAVTRIVKLLKAFGGVAIPRLDAVKIGWPVLVFCLGSAVLSAAVAGLIPALLALRLDPAEALKATRTSSAGKPERRVLGGIAIFQTAFTLALLTGAGLLIRTVIHLAKVHPGYEIQNILTMNVTDVHEENFYAFHGRALDRLAALPGVKNAAFAWGTPLTGNRWLNAVEIEGQPDGLNLPTRSVTPEYFDVLGQRIVAGRKFPPDRVVPADGIVRPDMAIINEAMQLRYFPNGTAVGRKIRVVFGGQPRSVEIIGVVSDARNESLTRVAEPQIYFSMWQAFPFTKSLIVRTAFDPGPLLSAIEHELRAIDPSIAIEHVKTLEQIRSESVAAQTFAMWLLLSFALIGSALALVGIYSVLSLSVISRRREIAIRMAVGAQRLDVLGLILRQGFKLIAGGLLLGTAAALALAQVLRALLFGVGPADPVTFAAGGTLFTVVASLACWLPARRAATVDPMEALRYE